MKKLKGNRRTNLASRRRKAVGMLAAQGRSNAEIAIYLAITPGRVSQIMRTLGQRGELVIPTNTPANATAKKASSARCAVGVGGSPVGSKRKVGLPAIVDSLSEWTHPDPETCEIVQEAKDALMRAIQRVSQTVNSHAE